ncbi:MAG: DUF721 domain-containing protein [Planctomycetes bacterium]|nr:DUF721 domain-containing protein [Planctomycetota bacterium]
MPEPQHVSTILSRVVGLRGLARRGSEAQLNELWRRIAGEKLAAGSRVAGIRRGVLQVAVDSAPLLSELAGFHRTSLLSAMRRERPDLELRDIKFRLQS